MSKDLEQIGKSALESILCLVAALECDYERLDELRDERDAWEPDEDGDAETWEEANEDDAEELAELVKAAGGCDVDYPCESRDDAQQKIEEDALEVQVRSGWCSQGEEMEAAEYYILLTTGGPAVRIIGELSGGEVASARLEVQDWGTPWTEYITTGSDNDALETYANCFYFGE